MNVVALQGIIHRQAERKMLDNGVEAIVYDIRFCSQSGREQVMVVWYDPPTTAPVRIGDEVVVIGRARRRYWRSGEKFGFSGEVVAEAVVLRRQRAKVNRLLDEAQRRIEEGSAV